MTRDDIIRIARQAGFRLLEDGEGATPWFRFAALVAAAEREACAQVCDKIERRKWEVLHNGGAMSAVSARDCGAAIRARGIKNEN